MVAHIIRPNIEMLGKYGAEKAKGRALRSFAAAQSALFWSEDEAAYAEASAFCGMAIAEHPTFLKTLKHRPKAA